MSGLGRLLSDSVGLARRAGRGLFALTIGLQVVAGLLLAVQVLLSKLALDAILGRAGDGDAAFGATVLPLFALLVALGLGSLATSAGAQLQRLLGERMQLQTWREVFGVAVAVRLETFETPEFFDDLQRVSANAVVRPITVMRSLANLASGVVGAIGVAIALLAVQPVLAAVMLAAAVPLTWVSRRTGRIEFEFLSGQARGQRLRTYLRTLLTGRAEAKEVRAFDLGEPLASRWEDSQQRYIDDLGRHVRRQIVLAAVGASITVLTTGVALGLLVWLVLRGDVGLATAGAALIGIRLLGGRIQTTFTAASGLFESALFLQDLRAFVARGTDAATPPPAGPREAFRSLELDDVTFAYPGADADAVAGVSMTLRAGEVVALVGENGSGKTTLTKLMSGLFAPTAGSVRLNGDDLREATDLTGRFGVIFQDFIRYQLTAAENVGYGRPEALHDSAAIEAAARRSGAHDVVAGLRDGYGTLLGKEFDGGVDLSIGQWQRIALARALFREPDVLILDEPTAALDPRSEAQVFEELRAVADGRAVLVISHRFSTVRTADRIHVLDGGRIVESGSHDELVALGGRYADLFELQARAYR